MKQSLLTPLALAATTLLFWGCSGENHSSTTLQQLIAKLGDNATATALDTNGNGTADALDTNDDRVPEQFVDDGPCEGEDCETPPDTCEGTDCETPPDTCEGTDCENPGEEEPNCEIPAETRIIKIQTEGSRIIGPEDLQGLHNLWIYIGGTGNTVIIDLQGGYLGWLIVDHVGEGNNLIVRNTAIEMGTCHEEEENPESAAP